MVLLDQLWDDVVAGPQPERGLEQLKKPFIKPTLNLKDVGEEASSKQYGSSSSMPSSPRTPGSPSAAKQDVWRSVFNPGSNLSTRNIGSNYYDKPNQPNSPTVYDWLYSKNSRSQHR